MKARVWLSPIAGAFAVALFLGVRALTMGLRLGAFIAFGTWFVQRVAVGYVCAVPVLGIARWFGVRHILGFMLLASLAALPLELYVSTPLNAWHPTDDELRHGFYWSTFIPAVVLASITGAVFFSGIPREKTANQPVPAQCR